MKKTMSVLVLLSVFVISMLLTACSKEQSASSSQPSTESSCASLEIEVESAVSSDTKPNNSSKPQNSSQKESVVSKPSQLDTEVYQLDYDDVDCREVLSFKELRFAVGKETEKKVVFNIPFPSDWEVKKKNGVITIFRAGKQIGTVTTIEKALEQKEKDNVFSGEFDGGSFTIYNDIYSVTTGKFISGFTRVLRFKSDPGLGITVAYDMREISGEGVIKLMGEAEMSISSVGAQLGYLPINDNRGQILILGNSFINSSQIGTTLSEMCGDQLTVHALSRGMAHVGTYTDDLPIMTGIKSGDYSAVFICGLYSQTALNSLEELYNACKWSDTRLVLLPAHNEDRKIITSACIKYPDIDILDWKGEIDEHIRNGVDIDALRIDDSYGHSKPLAGYIGAHMIYRSIFGRVPQSMPHSCVDRRETDLLGNYYKTGVVEYKKGLETYIVS